MSSSEDIEKKRPMEILKSDDGETPDNKRRKLRDASKHSEEHSNSNEETGKANYEDVLTRRDSEQRFHKEAVASMKQYELNFKVKDDVQERSQVDSDRKRDEGPQESNKHRSVRTDATGRRSINDRELGLKKEGPRSDSEDQDDETSTVKSDGSEKENIDIKKEKSHSPDVIMLSDEENGARILGEDGTIESAARRLHILKKIKALQNQLRNEEATLMLLKKLRQSQIAHPTEPAQQIPPIRSVPHHQQVNQMHMRPHGDPPPLVRGNQPSSKTLHSANQNSHMRGQQLSSQPSRSQQGPPPLVTASRTGNGHSSMSQLPPHGSRANVVQNMSRGSESRIQQQQTPQRQSVIPSTPPQPQDTQTPAQRQAAAKQALRKQLEKTLLQIPPPKPPPPEMNFIPSLACPDFVLLLGLEEVVNHMIDFQLIARGQKNPDERFVCTPFTCVQCGSDFTPVWKREKPGSKNVICEYCVTTNQKKALKQEHTNRLKSAFVKALQQEQEIERMQASSTPTPQPPPPSSTPQPLPAPMMSAASAAAAAVNAAAAAAAVASFRPSPEQIRQHHSLYQQAQLRAGQPLGLQAFSRSPFPYSIPFANQQDLQRQYLLDMIPRGSMSWKQ